MRIEFMAPEEYKREKDFRVDIQDGVHARACTGGSIALAQCHLHTISGKLPTGVPCIVQVRVTQPHALVMLKLLVLADRYNNIRGPKEARHDRRRGRPRKHCVAKPKRRNASSPRFSPRLNFLRWPPPWRKALKSKEARLSSRNTS